MKGVATIKRLNAINSFVSCCYNTCGKTLLNGNLFKNQFIIIFFMKICQSIAFSKKQKMKGVPLYTPFHFFFCGVYCLYLDFIVIIILIHSGDFHHMILTPSHWQHVQCGTIQLNIESKYISVKQNTRINYLVNVNMNKNN